MSSLIGDVSRSVRAELCTCLGPRRRRIIARHSAQRVIGGVPVRLTALTWFHTLLSIVALAAGVVVTRDLLGARAPGGWTRLFLVTAIATSITGFLFPFTTFGPSHWVGVLSLLVLALALLSAYAYGYGGAWGRIYAVSMVLTQYFLVFVLIAQLFMKVPALHAIAPTLAEAPFAVAQTVALVVFAVIAIAAARAFHYRPMAG